MNLTNNKPALLGYTSASQTLESNNYIKYLVLSKDQMDEERKFSESKIGQLLIN